VTIGSEKPEALGTATGICGAIAEFQARPNVVVSEQLVEFLLLVS